MKPLLSKLRNRPQESHLPFMGKLRQIEEHPHLLLGRRSTDLLGVKMSTPEPGKDGGPVF